MEEVSPRFGVDRLVCLSVTIVSGSWSQTIFAFRNAKWSRGFCGFFDKFLEFHRDLSVIREVRSGTPTNRKEDPITHQATFLLCSSVSKTPLSFAGLYLLPVVGSGSNARSRSVVKSTRLSEASISIGQALPCGKIRSSMNRRIELIGDRVVNKVRFRPR